MLQSTLKRKELKDQVGSGYPCMRKLYDGTVVLFKKAKSGTVVVKGEFYKFELGFHSETWFMCDFVDLEPNEYVVLR